MGHIRYVGAYTLEPSRKGYVVTIQKRRKPENYVSLKED